MIEAIDVVGGVEKATFDRGFPGQTEVTQPRRSKAQRRQQEFSVQTATFAGFQTTLVLVAVDEGGSDVLAQDHGLAVAAKAPGTDGDGEVEGQVIAACHLPIKHRTQGFSGDVPARVVDEEVAVNQPPGERSTTTEYRLQPTLEEQRRGARRRVRHQRRQPPLHNTMAVGVGSARKTPQQSMQAPQKGTDLDGVAGVDLEDAEFSTRQARKDAGPATVPAGDVDGKEGAASDGHSHLGCHHAELRVQRTERVQEVPFSDQPLEGLALIDPQEPHGVVRQADSIGGVDGSLSDAFKFDDAMPGRRSVEFGIDRHHRLYERRAENCIDGHDVSVAQTGRRHQNRRFLAPLLTARYSLAVARIRLGDLLIMAGLIDQLQLQSALALQKQWGGKLGDVLVNNGFLDEMMLWRGLSKQLGVPLVCLPDEHLAPGIEKLLPLIVCEKHSIFPLLREEKTLTLATSDPNNIGGLDEVAFRVGARLRIVLAPDREIEWAIRRYHRGNQAPCPPPRTKRIADAAPAAQAPDQALPVPELVAAPPATSFGHPSQTSAAELAAVAAMALQTSQRAAEATGSPAWWTQTTVSEAEVAVRETAHLLRFLMETCVQRGIFTREQYLAKLKSL